MRRDNFWSLVGSTTSSLINEPSQNGWAGSISSQASQLDQSLAWKLKYCNEKTIVNCDTIYMYNTERMDKGVVIPEFSARQIRVKYIIY